jgi:hypothetical protein
VTAKSGAVSGTAAVTGRTVSGNSTVVVTDTSTKKDK